MKITEKVHLIEASRGSSVYLIRGEETMLIDTGLMHMGKGIQRELETLCGDLTEIRHILLTHHDYDHIGNAFVLQQLTGAVLWASAEDIPYIYGEKDRSSFKKYFKYIFKVPTPENIRPYLPGETVNGIEIIPTPGHTPGHVCLLYDGCFFVGDLLENKNGRLRPFPKVWNWNSRILAESVKKAEPIPADWICPAHGRPVRRD